MPIFEITGYRRDILKCLVEAKTKEDVTMECYRGNLDDKFKLYDEGCIIDFVVREYKDLNQFTKKTKKTSRSK